MSNQYLMLFFLFWSLPRHLEVPRPGIKSEPERWPTPQLQQCGWILYPLHRARNQISTSIETSWIINSLHHHSRNSNILHSWFRTDICFLEVQYWLRFFLWIGIQQEGSILEVIQWVSSGWSKSWGSFIHCHSHPSFASSGSSWNIFEDI